MKGDNREKNTCDSFKASECDIMRGAEVRITLCRRIGMLVTMKITITKHLIDALGKVRNKNSDEHNNELFIKRFYC